MRGPRPESNVVKLVKGNPGRRRLPEAATAAPISIPQPPHMLKTHALKEWERITPLLQASGMITDLDMALVAAYCQAYSRWVSAEVKASAQELVVEARNGVEMVNRNLVVANKAMEQMVKLGELIGLSPISRTRMKAGAPAAAKDDAEDFLSARA